MRHSVRRALSERRAWSAYAVLAVTAAACATTERLAPGPRDPRWAVGMEVQGVENVFRVDAGLYRGAEPSPVGLDSLVRMGIRSVVSLRAFHSEREAVTRRGLGYTRVTFKVWHPEDEDMRRFLNLVRDPERRPVYVHCKRGADRTGVAVAVYRICVDGWTREEAVREMTSGGFHFAPRWTHLVRYVCGFDTSAVCGALAPASDRGRLSEPNSDAPQHARSAGAADFARYAQGDPSQQGELQLATDLHVALPRHPNHALDRKAAGDGAEH